MYVMDQAAADKVQDLRRGLHVAMTALITNGDRREAETVLRQMDAAFASLTSQTQIVHRR